MSETDYPPVGFRFEISFTGEPRQFSNSFSEVSGIKASLDFEEIKEGGENKFSYRIPTRGKYENLVLNRGLMRKDSTIMKWCVETLEGRKNKIEPKDISVRLMDADENPLMVWNFKDTWPVSWSVLDLDSTNTEIIIESLEFAYTYFSTEKQVITGLL